MIINSEEHLIEICKKKIESRLNWDSSEKWSNQDFEEIADRINDKTGVRLSNVTLKRIWGKVKYDSAPTTKTLDTLVQFIDLENWRAFRLSEVSEIENADLVTENGIGKEEGNKYTKPPKSKNKWIAIGLLIVSGLIWLGLKNRKNEAKILDPADYSFSIRKIVQSGLPNTVIFDYDASKAPIDSVFIQQSWDSTFRKRVSRNNTQHSSIYYHPGYFKAKLLVGNKIVKENDVFIQSNGWLSVIETELVPVYFNAEDALLNGYLTLPVKKIESQNISLTPIPHFVRYSNVREYGNLQSDNFIFETSVKNDFREGSSICQKTIVSLLFEGTAINISLCAKGCESDNYLFYLSKQISGKEHDLSDFGVDFSAFVNLKCEVRGNVAKFFIDGKLVYEIDYNLQKDPVKYKIKGLVYRFQGTGSVDYVKLSTIDGKVVYLDDF